MSLQEIYGLTDSQADEINRLLFEGRKDEAWDKLQEFKAKKSQD